VASAVRYPPAGRRSAGGVLAASDPFCLVMVESAEAVASLDDTLAVDGVDGIYVGPRDLSLALGCALLVAAGCAAGAKKPDKITSELLTETKEVLSEKGKALIAKGKYDDGRKYLNHVFETYPNETVGREALLLVADSYLKQKGVKNYTEARYRYRDYLNRYPGAPRRDYARYQFALCSDNEHEKPDRDQTATREAIEQYRTLIREFPDSGYAGAARERRPKIQEVTAIGGKRIGAGAPLGAHHVEKTLDQPRASGR
jgi:outer membrane assembly lipoprotein YfiO